MHANVPQFVDIEDKIAFGLTGKQLLWMGGMGAVLLVIYGLLDRQTFYVVGVFVVTIFVALAFWKPQGLSLLSFVGFVVAYFTKPRNYVWKRVPTAGRTDQKKAQETQRKKMGPVYQEKKLPGRSQLKRIAWRLDTAGKIHD